MTHQEMRDQISEEVRNSGDTSFPARMTRWINMSSVFLAQNYIFESLKKYATVNTATGNPDITLASDFLWPFLLLIPSQQKKLEPEDENILSVYTPTYRTMQGSVDRYYINGKNKMGLFHVPSEILTINYSYQARPAPLPGTDPNNEESDLPIEWHEMICLKSLEKAYRYDGNAEGHARNKVDQVEMLKSLGANRYRRPDVKITMGILSTGRGKPPRPRFPSNYPRV